MAAYKELIDTAFPSNPKKTAYVGKGRTVQKPSAINLSQSRKHVKSYVHHINQDIQNLKKTQKYLMSGQLTMIGDGLYEKETCSSCNEQHRIASVFTETCRAPKHCTLPSILSRVNVPSSSLPVKKESSVSYSSTELDAEVGKTVMFSREFCRKMLCQEEYALTERLHFEKKLLEETEKRYNKFELAELSYRKELEEEKRRYEAAKKRRLALQTILTALNDMPETTRQPVTPTAKQESSGGILRYNYSNASRKAVRIKDSSDDTTASDSNHTEATALSKYLTYASSQYLTMSSRSCLDTDESSSNESVILVGESKKTSAASIGDTSQTSPVSGKLIGSNSEQRLRHKDIFMQFGDRIPSKSSDQTSNRQMKTTKSSEATVKSAPTLIMSQVMTNITKEPSEKAKEMEEDLNIPSLIVTAPSNSNTADVNDSYNSKEVSEANEESDEQNVLAQSADEPQDLASKSSAAPSQSVLSTKSQTILPMVSVGTMLARNFVQKAVEIVMHEIQQEPPNAESSAPNTLQLEDSLACSSEEYLTMTATELVRNAIIKAQKDFEVAVSSSNLNTSTGQGTKKSSSRSMFSFPKLPSAKSIRKLFSF